jgi:ribosomal protein S18 acetylase RimI-like enzyme
MSASFKSYNTEPISAESRRALPPRMTVPAELKEAQKLLSFALNQLRAFTRLETYSTDCYRGLEEASERIDELNGKKDTLEKSLAKNELFIERRQKIISRFSPRLSAKLTELYNECDALLAKITQYRILPYKSSPLKTEVNPKSGSTYKKLISLQKKVNDLHQKINDQFLQAAAKNVKMVPRKAPPRSTALYSNDLRRVTSEAVSVNRSVNRLKKLEQNCASIRKEITVLKNKLAGVKVTLGENIANRELIKQSLKHDLPDLDRSWNAAKKSLTDIGGGLINSFNQISTDPSLVAEQRRALQTATQQISEQLKEIAPNRDSVGARESLETALIRLTLIIDRTIDRWLEAKADSSEIATIQHSTGPLVLPNARSLRFKITTAAPPDLVDIRKIEHRCFSNPRSDSWWKDVLTSEFHFVLCAKHRREVIGFAVYRKGDRALNLLAIAVEPEYQRQGVGKRFINSVKKKLHENCPFLISHVAETNLEAQKFFRAMKIKCTLPIPKDGQALRFLYRLKSITNTNQ